MANSSVKSPYKSVIHMGVMLDILEVIRTNYIHYHDSIASVPQDCDVFKPNYKFNFS